MKKFWKYIAVAALLVASACSTKYPEPSVANLPQASELDVTITVDQETNYVTFVMNNKGVVPIWIFGDQLVDGKASKSYAYAMNNLSLRFRDEGEYSVEVKAYNSNGITQGSIMKSFTLNNTYRDPFDPSPYIKALSNGGSQNWVWNSTADGHFGCGWVYDDDGNYDPHPVGWWACPAGGKEGFLYDDIMTFDADGNYTYDPVDGYAYAKHDAEYPAGHASESDDYLFPTEKQTSTYTFESEWNDAGIEEIYLVLAPGSILSYVAHKSIVDNPRYYVREKSTSAMKKKLQLMSIVYTPDNPDGIAYYYEFVPEGSADGGEEEEVDPTVYIIDGPTNLWNNAVIDPDIWYSPADWSGGLNPEYTINEDKGITITVPEGTGGGEWMGQTKLRSGIATDASKSYDFCVTLEADADMTVTIKVTGYPEGDGDPHMFFYDNTVELTKGEAFTYKKSNISQQESSDNLMVIFDFGRSPIGSTITASSICFQEHLSSEADFGDDSANLWNNAVIDPDIWYSPADWSGGLNPEYTINEDKGITITVPEGTGGGEWMGQTKLRSGIATDASKLYDFSVDLLADADMTVTIKVTGYPEGDGDPHMFFYDNTVELTNGETFTYVKTLISQRESCDNLMVIFDFGRSPIGSTITAGNIIFQEHVNKVDPTEAIKAILVGKWTWDPDLEGHFGCGPSLNEPVSWWKGEAHVKDDASMYDDVITFTQDNKYIFDPVDGMSYINKDVTAYDDQKVDSPYGDDFRISSEKQETSYELKMIDGFPVILLEEGSIFSYVPNDDFVDEPYLYIKEISDDHVTLCSWNGSISWQFILKKIN